MTSPDDLLKLLRGKFSHLIISFNDDHACNYEIAFDWGNYHDADSRIDWVSEEEKSKAIKNNSVWTIQWYPDTPIGFYCVGASTFEAAANYALAD